MINSKGILLKKASEKLGQQLPEQFTLGELPSKYININEFHGNFGELMTIADNNTFENIPKAKDYFRTFSDVFRKQNVDGLTNTDLAVFFTDWILNGRKHGFNSADYFNYELYNRCETERKTFVSTRQKNKFTKKFNATDKTCYFEYRPLFYEKFHKNVSRRWISVTSRTYQEFEEFINQFDSFLVNPVSGDILFDRHYIQRDEYAEDVIFEMGKYKKLVLEEIPKQHEVLNEVNSDSVNTVQLITLNKEEEPEIVLAAAKFGRAGYCSNSLSDGGLCAAVDIKTGEIVSDFADTTHIWYEKHPDSHIKAKGFLLPEWEKLTSSVVDAAELIKDVRYAGWEVTVKDDGEIEFMGGSVTPAFDVYQLADQKGKSYIFD